MLPQTPKPQVRFSHWISKLLVDWDVQWWVNWHFKGNHKCHFNSKTHMIWHSNHTWPLFLEGSPGSPKKRSSWVPAHCFMVKPKIMITTISSDSSHNWHTIPPWLSVNMIHPQQESTGLYRTAYPNKISIKCCPVVIFHHLSCKKSPRKYPDLPSGNLTVCYWTWP